MEGLAERQLSAKHVADLATPVKMCVCIAGKSSMEITYSTYECELKDECGLAPNKAFEYVRYAHRTASQLRRATAAQLCR